MAITINPDLEKSTSSEVTRLTEFIQVIERKDREAPFVFQSDSASLYVSNLHILTGSQLSKLQMEVQAISNSEFFDAIERDRAHTKLPIFTDHEYPEMASLLAELDQDTELEEY